jgi:hypothetical protein
VWTKHDRTEYRRSVKDSQERKEMEKGGKGDWDTAYGEKVERFSAEPDKAGDEAIRSGLSRSVHDFDSVELSFGVYGCRQAGTQNRIRSDDRSRPDGYRRVERGGRKGKESGHTMGHGPGKVMRLREIVDLLVLSGCLIEARSCV